MHAGGPRGGDDACRDRVWLEPGDILRNRAVEQLDVLRQIPDVAAERSRIPLIECGPSSRTLPRTACHTPTIARASDDLPEALGPMMPRALPALE